MKRGLLVVGSLIFLAGLVLGFLPQHAGGSSCGSVFRSSDAALGDDLLDTLGGVNGPGGHRAACDDRLATYRPIVWLLVILGGATLAAGGAMKVREDWAEAAEIRQTPQSS